MKTHHFKANINDEYKFEEISEYMEEYWKTHVIVPPYKGDPPYIVGRIVKENKNVYKRRQSN